MKTLKQYIGSYLSESLLDDEDELLGSERDKQIVENWIKENCALMGRLKINNDFSVDCDGGVEIENKNITSLTNGLFRWGKVSGDFCCAWSKKLKSLEGSPENVGGSFLCAGCENLTSLKGAPKSITENFNCQHCSELKSLESGPEYVGGDFDCTHCKKLKSLEGAPENIGGYFSCMFCKKLKSLEGAPEYVKKEFYCSGCPNLVITGSDRKKYKIRS